LAFGVVSTLGLKLLPKGGKSGKTGEMGLENRLRLRQQRDQRATGKDHSGKTGLLVPAVCPFVR